MVSPNEPSDTHNTGHNFKNMTQIRPNRLYPEHQIRHHSQPRYYTTSLRQQQVTTLNLCPTLLKYAKYQKRLIQPSRKRRQTKGKLRYSHNMICQILPLRPTLIHCQTSIQYYKCLHYTPTQELKTD